MSHSKLLCCLKSNFFQFKVLKQNALSACKIYFSIFYSRKTFLNKKAFKRLQLVNIFTQILHYSLRPDKTKLISSRFQCFKPYRVWHFLIAYLSDIDFIIIYRDNIRTQTQVNLVINYQCMSLLTFFTGLHTLNKKNKTARIHIKIFHFMR